MPNATLTKKTIRIDKDAVRTLDVSALEEQSINPNDWLTAGQSEYRLYAWLSSQFDNTTILDVGTRTGGSALALSYNDKNQVISYDLVEQGASSAIKKENITFKIQDFREDDTLDWDNVSIIMIDVDPHDGVQEVEMMEFLNDKGWKGIMLLDDIGPGWPEVQDMWDAIEEPKIDVTPVGHMSGTGLVNFGSKHDIDWA
jgi:predicted O-methyltransferase YrrM